MHSKLNIMAELDLIGLNSSEFCSVTSDAALMMTQCWSVHTNNPTHMEKSKSHEEEPGVTGVPAPDGGYGWVIVLAVFLQFGVIVQVSNTDLWLVEIDHMILVSDCSIVQVQSIFRTTILLLTSDHAVLRPPVRSQAGGIRGLADREGSGGGGVPGVHPGLGWIFFQMTAGQLKILNRNEESLTKIQIDLSGHISH